ncbi:MAG TPA: hypothetical protein VGP07_13060 [Polyangia bacterium]|jgi:hypothetical protein
MNDLRSPSSPETRAFLEHERVIVPQPVAVRERALARARASLAVGTARGPVHVRAAPRARWFVAAALVCVAGVAVGATTYEIRKRWATHPHELPAPQATARTAPSARPPLPSAASSPAPAEPPHELAPPEPRQSKAEAGRAELQLLRRARAAVAREDFASALSLLVEHTKRFRDGRLVEEREALRVKTLVGLGRIEEARRAGTAFETRFPHSVLLSTVTRMSNTER